MGEEMIWIVQLALLVAWYAWPAAAFLPWWLVFAPLLFVGACAAFALIFAATGVAIGAWIGRN